MTSVSEQFAKEAAKRLELACNATPFSISKEIVANQRGNAKNMYAQGGVIHRTPLEEVKEMHRLDGMKYTLYPLTKALRDNTLKIIMSGGCGMCEEKEDSIECRNWEFTVPHRDMVCPEEVSQYVTRENPVGIVCYNDYMGAFVHSSIIHKAKIIDKQRWEFTGIENSNIYILVSNHIKYKDVIEWAREVKKASWGDNKQVEQVRVIIPKI